MGKSSKDKRDAYYRLAKEQGWRARSAFKLLQLDEEFNLFEDCTRVVDLCAAPGSWSQVLSRILIQGDSLGREAWEDVRTRERLALIPGQTATVEKDVQVRNPRKDVRIVAIDLQPMSPLEGIKTLQADITHPSTIPLLLKALDEEYDASNPKAANPVDLVISDGAPDVTGLHELDTYVQSQLLWAALNLALCVLKSGGKFVAKIFRGKDVDLLYAQMKTVFESVTIAKPRSSRASSVEAFIVCIGFKPPPGFKASLENPLGRIPVQSARIEPSRITREDGVVEVDFGNDENDNRWIAPFLACGDLNSFDADATYQLPKDRITLDPVQSPTAPPYKRALEERKKAGGGYGKTKDNHNITS